MQTVWRTRDRVKEAAVGCGAICVVVSCHHIFGNPFAKNLCTDEERKGMPEAVPPVALWVKFVNGGWSSCWGLWGAAVRTLQHSMGWNHGARGRYISIRVQLVLVGVRWCRCWRRRWLLWVRLCVYVCVRGWRRSFFRGISIVVRGYCSFRHSTNAMHSGVDIQWLGSG